MKAFKLFFYAAVLVILAVAITARPANADENMAGAAPDFPGFGDRAAILEVNQQFMDAIAEGDAAAVALLYTPDAMLFTPGAPPWVGRAWIKYFFDLAIIYGGVKGIVLDTNELQIFPFPRMAYEVGYYQLLDADGVVLDEGPYIVIWKKVEKQWMLHRDIFNSAPAE